MAKTKKIIPEHLLGIDRWVTRIVKFFTWYGGFCFLSFIILPLFSGFDGVVKFLYWSGFFVMILFTIFELFVDIHGERFLSTIEKMVRRSS